MDDIVVFFDEKCLFCNNHVRFLLNRDQEQKLKFAPLQGTTASEKLPPELILDLNTMVVLDGSQRYLRMEAVAVCLKVLGGKWKWVARAIGCLPKSFQNWLYDYFAKRRYQWFGKLTECQLPTAEEKSRFLP